MKKRKKIKSDYAEMDESDIEAVATYSGKRKTNLPNARFMSKEQKEEIQTKRKQTLMARKTFEELVKEVGEENLPDELKASVYYSDNEQVNFQRGVVRGMYVAAVQGSSKAASFLRDTAGEKPIEKIKVETDLSDEEKLRIIEAEKANFLKE